MSRRRPLGNMLPGTVVGAGPAPAGVNTVRSVVPDRSPIRSVRRSVVVLAVGFAASAAVASCGGGSAGGGSSAATTGPSLTVATQPDTPCPAPDGSSTPVTRFSKAPKTCIDPSKVYRAKVSTSRGDFTITLDQRAAPTAVNNFVVLARYHYYDGSFFDHVIKDYVVQGGLLPSPSGQGPGYVFPDELPSDKSAYAPGVVAMNTQGANTNGSLFMVVVQNKGLAPRFTIFGRVTEGMDTTIAAINATGSPSGAPSDYTTISSITITESDR